MKQSGQKKQAKKKTPLFCQNKTEAALFKKNKYIPKLDEKDHNKYGTH